MYGVLAAAAVVFLLGVLSVVVGVTDSDAGGSVLAWGLIAIASAALTAYAARTTTRSFGRDAAKHWGVTAGAAVTLMGLLTLSAAWGFLLIVLGLVVLVLTLTPNA